MKKRKFFLHYNKPLSQQKKEMWMSVHHDKKCYFAREVIVNVPVKSKERKRQPRCVMEGYCSTVTIKDDIAVID
jgi:hypothetical protein